MTDTISTVGTGETNTLCALSADLARELSSRDLQELVRIIHESSQHPFDSMHDMYASLESRLKTLESLREKGEDAREVEAGLVEGNASFLAHEIIMHAEKFYTCLRRHVKNCDLPKEIEDFRIILPTQPVPPAPRKRKPRIIPTLTEVLPERCRTSVVETLLKNPAIDLPVKPYEAEEWSAKKRLRLAQTLSVMMGASVPPFPMYHLTGFRMKAALVFVHDHLKPKPYPDIDAFHEKIAKYTKTCKGGAWNIDLEAREGIVALVRMHAERGCAVRNELANGLNIPLGTLGKWVYERREKPTKELLQAFNQGPGKVL